MISVFAVLWLNVVVQYFKIKVLLHIETDGPCRNTLPAIMVVAM